MNHTIRQHCARKMRFSVRYLATLTCLSSIGLGILLPTPVLAEQDVIRILSLGDSITQAEINRASYRYPLWKKLIDADIAFDLVGSMQKQQDKYSKGTPPQPDYKGLSFDRDHEGHFGWEARDIIKGRNPNNGTGSGNLSQWVQGYDFDIVLVHLGTNDVFYKRNNAKTVEVLKTIVKTLRTDNPNAIILLAQTIPTSESDAIAKELVRLNEMIPGIVKEVNTRKSPVLLVNQYKGYNLKTDSYDGIHPNAIGEEKIAQRWFEAIQIAIQDYR